MRKARLCCLLLSTLAAACGGDGDQNDYQTNTGVRNPICPLESEDPARLREFVGMFPNCFRGSVCALDYGQFFAEAVSIVDTTCSDFVPAG